MKYYDCRFSNMKILQSVIGIFLSIALSNKSDIEILDLDPKVLENLRLRPIDMKYFLRYSRSFEEFKPHESRMFTSPHSEILEQEIERS